MTDAKQVVVPPRLRYLDGLRASAALFVLIHHTAMMAFPIRDGITPQGALGWVTGWIVHGHFGVTIFIVLAGHSLMLGLATKAGELPGGFWGFMKRRAWRIIPPYWAALALTIVLVVTAIGTPTGTHWDQSLPTSPKGWLVNALLLQDIIPVQNAAYTFWSISVEWHIYLLIPIMLLVRRRSNWTTAIGVGVALGVLGMVLTLFSDKFDRLHAEYYVVFALAAGGCLIVRLAPAWARRMPWLALATAAFVVVVALCLTNDFEWVVANYPWIDIVLGMGVVALLIALARGKAPAITRAFAWKPLAAMGAFSYSMYLVHAQLLQLFWQLAVGPFGLDRPMQLLVGWCVGVPLVCALSWLFYLIAERPFVQMRAGNSPRLLDTPEPAHAHPSTPPSPAAAQRPETRAKCP